MRLAKLSEFRRRVYTRESAPSLQTLREQIDTIPGGRKQGGRYYVDLDEFDQAAQAPDPVKDLRQRIEARQAELKRSPLLKGLI